MLVYVFPADSHRCGHRLIWPVEALRAQGADVQFFSKDDPSNWELEHEADVVVIQRPMLTRWLGALRKTQERGVTVVVDIDDNLRAMDPRNGAWAAHPREGMAPGALNWNVLSTLCREADLVTVSTPKLATVYGRPGRTVVVPNHVPASYLDVERRTIADRVLVGWSGSLRAHPDDLLVPRGAVGRAVAASGARFGLIGGPAAEVQRQLCLPEPPIMVGAALAVAQQPDSPGFVGLDDYPVALAALDVGIVPLQLTAFNESKSYLKGLEMAAVGVPFVASPTEQYRSIVAHAGIVARKPREWERAVRRLVEDEAAHVELAAAGRAWAATQTVEANAYLWWEAWERARSTTRRTVPA